MTLPSYLLGAYDLSGQAILPTMPTAVVESETRLVGQVQGRLLEWYAQHARDLPWRRTRDPYAILVAEVMLQQTQVDRVIPKWHAWLEQFPSIAALARASRADAIRAWQGLGYNMRAVRLHAIATQVAAKYDGDLPRTVDGLLALKGIGRYTAGAIACFAYEQPVAMVDTNIRRVLSRVFSVEPGVVETLADALIPERAAYAWNQGLMDLGATLCRASQPLCLVCPLVAECGGPVSARRVARPQGEFRGSSRYFRGRLIARLSQLPNGALEDELISVVDGDPGRTRAFLEALAAEGFVSLDGQRRVRLAE
jgi:A/G-specific adenine glycosylase